MLELHAGIKTIFIGSYNLWQNEFFDLEHYSGRRELWKYFRCNYKQNRSLENISLSWFYLLAVDVSKNTSINLWQEAGANSKVEIKASSVSAINVAIQIYRVYTLYIPE